MPELPEVETIKNTLKNMIGGRTIKSVDVLRAKTVENDIQYFKNCLKDARICDFSRVGKFIIFILDKPYVLICHLRMEGKFFLRKESEKYSVHDMAIFHFENGTYLAYNDTRRFGILKVLDKENYISQEPLCRVGPDPFMMKDASILIEAFKNKNVAIKPSLLDQSVMSGLGNIYVDEVLYECRVHPETPAKMISPEKLTEIWEASKIILKQAIHEGGSTIKSYHPTDGVDGNFQVNLKVYGKKDGICSRCGHRFRKTVVGGRGTTYCPHCQKNPNNPYILGLTGPIGSGKSLVSSLLKERGFNVIDADEVVHNLYKQKDVIDKIAAFIPGLKVNKGEIDRTWLREYLLDNPYKKHRLESLVHQLVDDYIHDEIKKHKNTEKFVLEVPLLFESSVIDYCDETMVIDLPIDKQKANLVARGSNVEESLKLNQNYNQDNKKKATYVINNDGDIDNLKSQLNKLSI